MSSPDADVIVVGAGPAGAATARHLASMGHAVILLDRATFPREKPCAEFLSPGTVAALYRLGVMTEVTAAEPDWLPAMRVRMAPGIGYDLGYGVPDGAGSALGIPRPVLDSILLDAAGRAGADVRQRVRVRGVLRDAGRVVGVRIGPGRGDQELRARFVVGADGRHSAISRTLGLDLPVRWPRRLGLVARYRGAELDGVAQMHVGRNSYCGLAPVGRGLVNAGLVVPLGAKPAGEPTADYFERAIAAIPGAARALGGAERVTRVRGVGPLAHRVRSESGPGFLLVGDAAGFLDPFTGEGIHRALIGAELASRSLSRALDSGAVAPIGYDRARRDAFRDKERLSVLIQLFLLSRPLFSYVVRRLGSRRDVAEVLTRILGDLAPAGPALQPSFLWSLLRP